MGFIIIHLISERVSDWLKIDGATVETVRDFIFWAPKSLQMVTNHEIKRCLLFGRKAIPT